MPASPGPEWPPRLPPVGLPLRSARFHHWFIRAVLADKAGKTGLSCSEPNRAYVPFPVATTLRALLEDERSTATTTKALACLDQLFVTPASTGTRLAVDALRTVLPEDTVSAAMTVYAAELRRAVP